jgi:D-erythro-7,8-dihydroneopterin triphosphate epimerase
MTDEIFVKDLLVRAIVGINEEERVNLQDILINIVLYVDTRSAARSDDIEHAVNYRTLTKNIIDMVEASQFYLVEKLTTEIVRLCLADNRVERARVSVEKPTALRFARSVGVTIERAQGDDLE